MHPDIVALLRRHGADGWTELMVAAYEGDTEAARLLSIYQLHLVRRQRCLATHSTRYS